MLTLHNILIRAAERLDDEHNIVADPTNLYEDPQGRPVPADAPERAACGCVEGNIYLAARDLALPEFDIDVDRAAEFVEDLFADQERRTDEPCCHHGPTMALKYQGHAYCAERIRDAVAEARR